MTAPYRPCDCGLLLGQMTCPICLVPHTWYHMTLATGNGEEHYVSCDKYVESRSTLWFLATDKTIRFRAESESVAFISDFRDDLPMPLSENASAALKKLADSEATLSAAEEVVLQTAAVILQDTTIPAPQRIQLSNFFVNSSANIRNSITQIQSALAQAKQLVP